MQNRPDSPRCLTAALILGMFLGQADAAWAQEKSTPPNDLLESAEQWMRENLDDSVLEALSDIDRDRVRQFLTELQRRFQGTSVYDLASLLEAAKRILPVLDQFEETQPYAVWLQTHLDYLEAADELERAAKPVPPQPGRPIPRPIPTLLSERTVWTKQLQKRPLPPLASTYVPRLKQVFAAERVPRELVWLAEVESSFDSKARSPAGAVGMFQLMPATAHDLKLSSWPRDERLQPEKSAQAAARRLRSLYTHYGDWRLALAAYNTGQARVDQLLKKQKARTYDAIAHRLPAETQMYVPKVEATLRRREGVALGELRLPKG